MDKVDPSEAFARRFPGLTSEQFDGELHRFINEGDHAVREVTLSAPEYRTQIRVLSDDEVHTIRAKIDLAAEGVSVLTDVDRKARIRANLDEAKAADELALDALVLDLVVSRRPTTPAIARRLVVAYPDEWLAWLVADAAFSTSPEFIDEAVHARKQVAKLRRQEGISPGPKSP
ncbi:MAG TPA: hypothetical protein VF518_14525 [Polyangia bacterium]